MPSKRIHTKEGHSPLISIPFPYEADMTETTDISAIRRGKRKLELQYDGLGIDPPNLKPHELAYIGMNPGKRKTFNQLYAFVEKDLIVRGK